MWSRLPKAAALTNGSIVLTFLAYPLAEAPTPIVPFSVASELECIGFTDLVMFTSSKEFIPVVVSVGSTVWSVVLIELLPAVVSVGNTVWFVVLVEFLPAIGSVRSPARFAVLVKLALIVGYAINIAPFPGLPYGVLT